MPPVDSEPCKYCNKEIRLIEIGAHYHNSHSDRLEEEDRIEIDEEENKLTLYNQINVAIKLTELAIQHEIKYQYIWEVMHFFFNEIHKSNMTNITATTELIADVEAKLIQKQKNK